VDRTACGVQVTRVTRPEWECTELLARGIPLDEALGRADEVDAAALLAEHFARGRFTGFAIAGDSGPVSPS
jgi:hypothetical protein